MTGLRPIAELMFSDFFAVTWDMVANQIAKTRYMTDGQVSLPLVLRTANGGGPPVRRPAQPEHRELGDGDPGPQGRRAVDARPTSMGLMAAAIRDPDPVIFCEHKALFATKGEVPDGEHVDAARAGGGRPRRARTARSSRSRRWSRGPSRRPSGSPPSTGSTAEVIDLRSLVPLDAAGRSSRRSRRRAGSSRSRRTRGCCGWGAEIVSIVADEGFYSLDAPIVRITTPHIPLPSAPVARGPRDPVRRPDRRDRPPPARGGEVGRDDDRRDRRHRPDGLGDGARAGPRRARRRRLEPDPVERRGPGRRDRRRGVAETPAEAAAAADVTHHDARRRRRGGPGLRRPGRPPGRGARRSGVRRHEHRLARDPPRPSSTVPRPRTSCSSTRRCRAVSRSPSPGS